MATQYDPIAKDGSLNTTEATPRNIADVLAEGLKGIEDALPPSYTEGDGIDISNDEISVDTTFTEASTRANIASGDSFSTILGKIKKFFTDLKTVAFSGAAEDLTYDNTSSGLSATDAQGAIDEVDGTLDRFTNGVAIPANADLNTVTTSGTYYSPNNATTQSLTNCPVPQYGFEMSVFNWGGNTAQFIHGYERAYFRRALTDSWITLARTDGNNNFTENQTIDRKDGTTSSRGISRLILGNNVPEGTDKNSYGYLQMYSNGANYVALTTAPLTANRYVGLPDKDGTIALTSDINDVIDGAITTTHTLQSTSSLKRAGKICQLNLNMVTTNAVAQFASIGSIPSPFRPLTYAWTCDITGVYALSVGSNGTIQTQSPLPSGAHVIGTFTYIGE